MSLKWMRESSKIKFNKPDWLSEFEMVLEVKAEENVCYWCYSYSNFFVVNLRRIFFHKKITINQIAQTDLNNAIST